MVNVYTDIKEIIPGIDCRGLVSLEEGIGRSESHKNDYKNCGSDEYVPLCKTFLSRLENKEENCRDILKIIPKSFEILENSLRALNTFNDQIFIDIGCGQIPLGYTVATMFSAKAYVAVEPFYYSQLDAVNFSEYKYGQREIPIAIIPEDMRTFLKRVPDDSISIFASGIDDEILPIRSYKNNVESEITRSLHKNGCFIQFLFKSTLKPKGLNQYKDNFVLFIEKHSK